jgi:hypothetical protein
MKAPFSQKALYPASPILPQAAFPALPARGGAAVRHAFGFMTFRWVDGESDEISMPTTRQVKIEESGARNRG